MRHRSFIALGSALFLLALTALADYPAQPAWWTAEDGTAIITPGATPQNYAPLNLGQLKAVAARAKKHLDLELAAVGGAGPDITNMVANFTVSSPFNYAPANLG